jgi:hypothetical protein
MNKTKHLIRKYFARKQDKLSALPGFLGNEGGTVNVPNRPNYVYARIPGYPVAEVYNNRVAPLADLPVLIGTDPLQPSITQVLGVRSIARYGEDSETISPIQAHANTHRFMGDGPGGGSDVVWTELRQFLPWRLGPGGGLTVHVYRGVGYIDGAWQQVAPATTVDLSSYVPVTDDKVKFVLISIDTSGAITVTDGVEVDPADLGLDDIPAVPAGTAYALGAVRLYTGQTEIVEARTDTDIVDLRFPMWHTHDERSLPGISVEEEDGVPAASGVHTLKFPSNTVTDNGDGSASISFNGSINASAYIYSTCFWLDGTNRSLVLLVSADGQQFVPITIKPPYTVASDRYLQEPSIIWWDGFWYVCYTYGAVAGETSFQVIRSPDLINWTLIATVDMTAITGVKFVWAPEFFVDSDGTVRVYATCTINADWNHDFKVYEVHATAADLSTWSAPVEVTGTGMPASIIDAFMLKVGDTYYLWYKDNGPAECINYATSANPTSGFTQQASGDWAGWGARVEGPTVIQLPDGRYRAYFQHYEWDPYRATQWWSEASNLAGPWSAKVQVVAPWPIVHGSVLRVTDLDALATLLAASIQGPGGHWWEDTGDVGLVLNAGVNGAAGNQKDYIEFRLDGVVKAILKVDEATSGNPLETDAQLKSTVAPGTAPIQVTSPTMCPNLNAEMVGGKTVDELTARAGELLFDEGGNILLDDGNDGLYEG